MKNIILLLVLLSINLYSYGAVMEGGVSKTGTGVQNRVVDFETNQPIPHAKVMLPQLKFSSLTDENGTFTLNADINGDTILSVEKEGYKPFSITINRETSSAPMVMAIQKSNIQDIILSSEMFHLGDDNYSDASANSGEFKGRSLGPFYTKTFLMTPHSPEKTNYLVIGSIIGIDTLLAKKMGQNKIIASYSSAPEIYFNGNKIAEIQINGDGQKVKLPSRLIKPGLDNEITIKTGRNQLQTAYIDYDDIEFMNLSIESE